MKNTAFDKKYLKNVFLRSKLQPPISYKTFIQENGVIVKPPCVHTPSSKPHRNSVSEYTPTATGK